MIKFDCLKFFYMNYTNGKTDLTDEQITELVTKKIYENQNALEKLAGKNSLTPNDLESFYNSWMKRLKEIWQTVYQDVWDEPREPGTNLITKGSKEHWELLEKNFKEKMKIDIGENKIIFWSSSIAALINTMNEMDIFEEEEYNELEKQLLAFKDLGASNKVHTTVGHNYAALDKSKLLDLCNSVCGSGKSKGK